MKIYCIILISIMPLLFGCSSEESTTTNSGVPKESFEHYTGKFPSMQQCLNAVKKEAKKAGMELSISSDNPDKVTGSFNGDADMFFVCQLKETGTEGSYYEAMLPIFKATNTNTKNSKNNSSKKYSANKKKWMKSCTTSHSEELCSCQFDVINPILAQSIGKKWQSIGMHEKHADKYQYAVEQTIQQCPSN